MAQMDQVAAEATGFTTSNDVKRARDIAFISLVSPVLFMASLVSAAILLMGDLGGTSDLFAFWLLGHCFLCGALFLLSLRERSQLFDQEQFASSLIKRFSFVSLGVCWGCVPGMIALIEPTTPHLVFGAILSGTTLASTLLLQFMPRAGRILLATTVGGFFANMFFQPDIESAAVSLIMMAYFSGLAVCTRWYFSRFSKRLEEVEVAAERTREINSVLRDVGFATDTCFWRTDSDGFITEISNDELLGNVLSEALVGTELSRLFRASPERDLLRSRIARGSEIVALELQVADTVETSSQFWKISGRPVFNEGEFTGYRGSATDISQLRQSEDRASFLAEYDPLTGLMNRASFAEALERHFKADFLETSQSALVWIDLDNFKWINDTFGHDGGDEILKLVAQRLEDACEPMDLVCRYGGDEFALLVTRPHTQGRIIRFVEELTESLQQPYAHAKTDVQCGASLGLRRIEGKIENAAALMKEADLALYAAKTDGRGSWKEYSDSFKAQVRGQRELARDLLNAIEEDTLNLQFQPIMNAETGAVSAVEALSRWYHPERGAVAPAEFIPVAEDNGMIIALGDRVIENSIMAALDMPENVRIGINISPLQLHSNRLLSLIEQKIDETGISAERIELEITESVFLSDNTFILERLRKLKALGLRIAMDDFGTGFSSLAYLQRFPFDKLKLDQAFVRGIETSDQSCAIARATISMAHALGLTVTAEGVESEAQARFLREQGCDELQGYLFSRPQEQSALIPYLRSMELLHGAQAIDADPKVLNLKAR